MIWSDFDIRGGLARGDIGIFPEPDLDGTALQPASLELGLGEDVYLAPNQFALSHTIELVSLGQSVAAQLNGKSSLARLGLMIHSTGGWIDPGFTGQIVLEMKNIGDIDIELHKGARVAQLVFHQLKTESLRPYGHRQLGSHYQGQTGNTPSHLEPGNKSDT